MSETNKQAYGARKRMKSITKHANPKRTKEYVSMDCYYLRLHCDCGFKAEGWIREEIEDKYYKHLEEVNDQIRP